MKTNLKKAIAFAVCLAMLLTLVACGGDSGSSATTPNSSTTSSSESSKEKEEESIASSDANTQDDLPELKMLIQSGDYDPNEYYITKKMKELTGYTVNYEMLPKENMLDVLNLKLAGGSDYDIFTISYSTAVRSQMDKWARQGALAELDDLIAQYGPNLEAKVNQRCWDMTAVDGKRFIIANLEPSVVPEGNAWCPFYVRTDMAKEINMEFPDTRDGFVEYLKAIKEKYGDSVAPFSICPTSDMSYLMGAFDLYFKWNDVDGTLTSLVEDPRYKEYLTFMADLYSQGLLDVDYPTNLADTVVEKFTSGKAAVVMGISTNNYGTTEDALVGAIEGAAMDVFGPIKNAKGKAAAGGTTGLNAISAIPAASVHQEDAMKYINAKLEDETFKISTIGEEGYTHKKISDTEYEPIAPTFLEELNYGSNFLIGADDEMYPIYWKQCRLKKDIRNYDAAVKMMEGTNIVQIDPMKISPLLPIYCEYTTSLEQAVSDFEVSVICGTASVDTLETFAQQYMNDGGAEVKEEVNAWWAEYRDTYYADYGYTLE
ncbi:extracellular solute-binding protein [Acutalibacter intestini]|uniref:extracellular solute-binding protein n=1 Tax=Acutalibacter intestini TaxID=3093659 RepID=UPI002AC92D6B|nr:extracellular solute-binding protein [Acutalibacter sp. M00204]